MKLTALSGSLDKTLPFKNSDTLSIDTVLPQRVPICHNDAGIASSLGMSLAHQIRSRSEVLSSNIFQIIRNNYSFIIKTRQEDYSSKSSLDSWLAPEGSGPISSSSPGLNFLQNSITLYLFLLK